MQKLAVLSLLLVGCPEPSTTDTADDTGTGSTEIDISLQVTAMVGTEAAACGVDYALGTGETTAQLADARLFLSDLQLRTTDGNWMELILDDTDWQTDGVVLLDFEDGTGACADSGTSQLNHTIVGSVADADYDAVRFEVGVPFELNHNDSATAPAPFNTPGMFWVWQSGYKFLRVDFMATERWNVHVGSTGCTSEGSTAPPDGPCTKSNRSAVELELDPTAEAMVLDLAALVAAADIGTNTADTPPGCMSMPTEPSDCAGPFGALGLDFSTGDCEDDCGEQSLFDVTAR